MNVTLGMLKQEYAYYRERYYDLTDDQHKHMEWLNKVLSAASLGQFDDNYVMGTLRGGAKK